jgi:2-polyprenyl-3-methyl-5-hydroxy-6-metoxy-1,4-benzoquinol methylase
VGERKDEYGRQKVWWVSLFDEVYDFLEENQVPAADGATIVDKPVTEPLLACDAVATGAMAIHRSVFEALEPPWFEYVSGGYGEDIWFCNRVRTELGLQIYCDLSTISGHYHFVPMGQAQFRQEYLGRGINMTSYSKRDAANWLVEYQDIDFEQAIKKIEESNAHMVGDYWNEWEKHHKMSPQRVEEFYTDPRTGELYLLELLHWNFSWGFAGMRQLVQGLRNLDIIEIGAGIGTIALQLIVQNNNVLAVEPNDYLRNFILHRWNTMEPEMVGGRYGTLMLDAGKWLEQTPDESFDVAVSFDTFEHMDIATLKINVKNIARVLKPGGRLIYHNNFGQQDLYPMHFNHTAVWPTLLREAGFAEINPYAAVKAG